MQDFNITEMRAKGYHGPKLLQVGHAEQTPQGLTWELRIQHFSIKVWGEYQN